MGGQSGSTQTQVSTRELPTWAQPLAVEGLHTAYNTALIGNQKYPYPNQQVSPLTSQQQQGLQMAQDRAIAGSPVQNAANQNLLDTLNGKYMDVGSNPAWAPMAQRITDAYSTGTAAQTDAAAARANALGSSGYNEQVGLNQRSLGDSLAGAAGQLYNDERSRQMQANLFAPQAAQADFNNAQALLGVGDTYRQYNQDVLNNNFQNQYNTANWPYQKLSMFGDYLNQFTGGQGTQSQTGPNPYQPSKAAGALGGAAAGGALGGALAGTQAGAFLGPWGMVGGAALGGLAGLLM